MKEIMTMINYGSLYKTYKNKFYEAVKRSKEKHLPMAWDEQMSMEQFKGFFEATRVSMIEEGKNPSNNQVVKAIVDRQQYGASEAQGRVLQKAMAMRGIEVDLATARAYQAFIADGDAFEALPESLKRNAKQVKTFYDEIEDFYWKKKAEGYDVGVIKTLIAQVYFGSP